MRTTLLTAIGVAAIGTGCSGAALPGDRTSQPATVAAVTISPPSISTQVGKTLQLSATAKDSAGNVLTNRAATWSSTDTTIAQVSNAGMLSARVAGTAVIHASIEGKDGSAAAVVAPIPVASVTISPTAPSAQVGGSVQFAATTRDAAGNVLSGRAITWTSSNTAVATMNATGLGSALAAGTTTVVATSEGISGQTSLTVTSTPPPPAPVASVTVTLGASSLGVGQTTQATAVLRDASGNVLTGRTVTWSSSNTGAATVSGNGLVSAVAAGSANIVATSEGVTGQAQVTVTVAPPAPVASVAVTLGASSLTVGQTTQASAVTKDGSGNTLNGRTVTWSSANTSVATVNASGIVSAVGAGTANIVATSEGVTGQAALTVTVAPVASVTVTLSASSLTVGQTTQASAVTKDASGNVLNGRSVTWTSSNTSVATVNANGLVTSVAAGSANIVATSEGIAGQATLTVTLVPVASVTVTLNASTLTAGQTGQATAVMKDAAGNVLQGRTVTWSSSKTSVATVSATGAISAVAAGSANMIATSEGVSGQATLTVTAAAPPPVATVTVTLNPSSLTAGQTGTATAATKDASGNVLAGRTIAWSSSNTAVATVGANGAVVAVAQGTATITATSEGISGSATLTVNPATSGPIDTLFVDRFESGSLGDAGRWQDIVNTGASIVSAASEGISAVSGTQVLKLANPGAGITHFVSTAATSPYEHLYLSFRMYRTTAYEGANPGLRAGGIRGSTTQWGSFGVGYGTTGSCPDDPANVHQQEFMFAYAFGEPTTFAFRAYTEWLGEVKLTTNPPTCGGNYATAAGSTPAATYFDPTFTPTVNAWHQYEVEVQLNDVGQANGWQRMWVDGGLKEEHVNVRYRTTAGMKLWAVTFDTGNIAGTGALYVDDVIVATSRAP